MSFSFNFQSRKKLDVKVKHNIFQIALTEDVIIEKSQRVAHTLVPK